MKQTAISDTENPRESLLNYMSECIKLFISTISQIDPTLSNQELFEKNYKELLRSFLDDISQHPLLSSMSKDEKRIIIKKAVEIASKQV